MSRPDLPRDVGRLLRTTREARGLSQARLAERVGASQQWLSRIERGIANPTLVDLARFFDGLRLRLRFEAVPSAAAAVEDPDLVLDLTTEGRHIMVAGFGYLLGRLSGVPYVVGGRLAALAHGLPVRVARLDLIVAQDDLATFAGALQRLGPVRWNERWQEFLDLIPADRPGPMRWQIGGRWELRASLVDELPDRVRVRLGELELAVPPLPYLMATDPDFADLAGRLDAVGWVRAG